MIFNNHGVPIWWVRTPTLERQGASERERPLVQPRVQPVRDPPPRRDPRPRPQTASATPPTATTCSSWATATTWSAPRIQQSHVDTSAYGGSSDATVQNAELQEVSPRPTGLGLEDPGPHLPGRDRALVADIEPSAWLRHRALELDPAGTATSVIASFRHLDAVYKIDKSTGRDRLEAGRHEPAREPERDRGSIRVHLRRPTRRPPAARRDPDRVRQSHRSDDSPPRAVRFRIDETAGTATLLQSISDPDVPASVLLWLGTAPAATGTG